MMEAASFRVVLDVLLLLGALVALVLYVRERRRRRGPVPEISPQQPVDGEDEGVTADDGDPMSTALFLGPVDDPVLSIRPLCEPVPEKGEVLSLNDQTHKELEQILQHAPRLIIDQVQATQELLRRHYVVKFSREARARLATGRWSYMRGGGPGEIRAVLVDTKSGRIVEQARLARGRVSPASLPNIAFHIASIVTAQKYLADIDRRLANLETQINEVKRFLGHELDATIQAQFGHIQRIGSTIQSFELDERNLATYAITLEHTEVECARMMEQLKRLLEDHGVAARQLPGGRKVEEIMGKAEKRLEEAQSVAERYLLVASIRAAASEIRGTVGLHDQHALRILRDLEADVASVADRATDVHTALTDLIPKISNPLRFKKTWQAHEKLRALIDESRSRVTAATSGLSATIREMSLNIERRQEAEGEALSMEVATDQHGHVLEVRRLLVAPEHQDDCAQDVEGERGRSGGVVLG